MAYGNKYTVSFADIQDRAHVVYLDLDGYGGSSSALTPIDDALTWEFGSDRGDIFAQSVPTNISIGVIVSDSTVFLDIAGDAEKAWRLRWYIGGSQVWTGHVLTDELSQPIDVPGVLVIRAVCGLVTADNIAWSPASESRQTIMPLVADALGDIGHGLQVLSYANWHAGAPPDSLANAANSSAVTGNSFARYEILPTNFKNTDSLKYATSGFVLSNLAGLFGATLFQADNRWILVQREAIAGSGYTGNVYDSAGAYSTTAAVSTLSIDTSTQVILANGTYSAARGFGAVETRYSHGDLGYEMFYNTSFETWAGGLPSGWTEIDEDTVTAPNTGSIASQYETLRTPQYEAGSGRQLGFTSQYGAEILGALSPTYEVNAVNSAKTGLMQNGQTDIASGAAIEIGITARLVFNSTPTNKGPRPCYFSIWLDGDAGTDYYWNDAAQTWTAGTLPTHTAGGLTETVASAAKNRINIPASGAYYKFITKTGDTPDSGQIRIVLYNVVGIYPVDTIRGVVYDDVALKVTGDQDYAAGTIRTAISDATIVGRPTYDAGTYLSGTGPTANHKRGITFSSGTLADNWKAGAYADQEALSGVSLEYVRAQRALVALGTPPLRLRCSFESTSGTYWPHQPLSLDGVVYTCVSLRHSARYCQYTGEWVENKSHSYTPSETETVIYPWVNPGWQDDFYDGGTPPKDATNGGPRYPAPRNSIPAGAYSVAPDYSQYGANIPFSGSFSNALSVGGSFLVDGEGTFVSFSRMQSSDWDGVVDQTGEITTEGTTGWIITGQGDAEFNIVNARQRITIGTDVVINEDGITIAGSVATPTYSTDPTVLLAGPLVVHGGLWDLGGLREAAFIGIDESGGTTAGYLTLSGGTDAGGKARIFGYTVEIGDVSTNDVQIAANTTIVGTTTLNSLAYTWPASHGTNYYLKNDGSGNLTWAAVAGVSAIDDLSDVDTTGVVAGALLYYASDTWVDSTANATTTTKFLSQVGDGADAGAPAWTTLSSSDVGLGNVENTALSTWAGSANITTVGTISSGTWQGTAIGDTYISSAATWNAAIQPSDTPTLTGNWYWDGNAATAIATLQNSPSLNLQGYWWNPAAGGSSEIVAASIQLVPTTQSTTGYEVRVVMDHETLNIKDSGTIAWTGSTITAGGNTVWHAGNDGASSGLDADLLDGSHASAFLTTASTPTLSNTWTWGSTTTVALQAAGATLTSLDSDAGNVLRNSPYVQLLGNWWNAGGGGSPEPVTAVMQVVPTAQSTTGYELRMTLDHTSLAIKDSGVLAWSGSSLTVGGAAVYIAGGTDVAIADGGTNKSSWTADRIVYSTSANVLGEISVGFGLTVSGSALQIDSSQVVTYDAGPSAGTQTTDSYLSITVNGTDYYINVLAK